MATVHIACPMGGKLDVSDDKGMDLDPTDLNDRIVKIVHVTRDEIVFEVMVPGEER
jgi:hypothetical protein